MVTVFIPSEKDAAPLVTWGVRFAQSSNSNLQIVFPRKSKGKEAVQRVGRPDAESENNIHVKIFDEIDKVLNDQVLLASPPDKESQNSIGDTIKDNPDAVEFVDSTLDQVCLLYTSPSPRD